MATTKAAASAKAPAPKAAPKPKATEPKAPEAPKPAPTPKAPAKSPVAVALEHIDATGKALQKGLDALWVEWDDAAQSGAVYWHHGAEVTIRAALQKLLDLEEHVKAIPYPEQGA